LKYSATSLGFRSRPQNKLGERATAIAVGVQLLILDDWGLEPLDGSDRRDLYEIVEERYGRRSTVLTSLIPIDKWQEIIGNPPVPTPSSTASSTTPIASISPATACDEPYQDQLSGSDQRYAFAKKHSPAGRLKRATSCRNSERHDLGMTERLRRKSTVS
jgi:IstB-like ATP binding protein